MNDVKLREREREKDWQLCWIAVLPSRGVYSQLLINVSITDLCQI